MPTADMLYRSKTLLQSLEARVMSADEPSDKRQSLKQRLFPVHVAQERRERVVGALLDQTGH